MKLSERYAELEEEFYEEWHPAHGTNMIDMLVYKLVKEEDEVAKLEQQIETVLNIIGRTADWIEKQDQEPLEAISEGYPSAENMVNYLRQRKWEEENADALLAQASEE